MPVAAAFPIEIAPPEVVAPVMVVEVAPVALSVMVKAPVEVIVPRRFIVAELAAVAVMSVVPPEFTMPVIFKVNAPVPATHRRYLPSNLTTYQNLHQPPSQLMLTR